MALPAGLEPATLRLEGGCSIQLSYGSEFSCNSHTTGFNSIYFEKPPSWSGVTDKRKLVPAAGLEPARHNS